MTDKEKAMTAPKPQAEHETQAAQDDFVIQPAPNGKDSQVIASGEVLTTITGADKLQEKAAARLAALRAALDPDGPDYRPELAEAWKQGLEKVNAVINAVTHELKQGLEHFAATLPDLQDLQAYQQGMQQAAELWHEVEQLEPFIKGELAKDPAGMTWEQLLHSCTLGDLVEMAEDPGSAFAKALAAARTTHAETIKTSAKRAEKVDFPLDKVNSTIWGLLEKDTQGQIALKAEKAGSKDELSIFYAINFDALANVQISKRLTAFDKIVYIATAALYNAGNEWVTLTQIYYALGNNRSKTPASYHLEKILNSLQKMKAADIFIDNAQEAGKYNYPSFRYEGDLLPMEKITASINGKLTDAAIHLFREPPLVTFAKQRNQVTTISVKLLAAPINKTEKHLAIQDYLLERISRAKHGTKKQERILLATLTEKAKDTTGKQGRIQEAAETYLKHFKAEAWIKGYTTDKAGITIYF